MKRTGIILSFFMVTSLAVVGCGDDDGDGDVDAAGVNAMPTLGTQVDRMGRAAVSTALIGTFNPTAATRNTEKDAYNADATVSGWGAAFTGAANPAGAGAGLLGSGILGQFAVYDSLTGPAGARCGDHALIAIDLGAGAGDPYSVVSSVIADDRLYVNLATNTCDTDTGYLAVEVAAITGGALADCGGRTPLQDVIDVSYNFLALGSADVNGPATDGIDADADTNAAQLANFPYLGAPNVAASN